MYSTITVSCLGLLSAEVAENQYQKQLQILPDGKNADTDLNWQGTKH